MSAMEITSREMRKGYETSQQAGSVDTPNNAHRLLKFYAVECGLKCVWMKRNSRHIFDKEAINNKGHDLRPLMKELYIAANLYLPSNIKYDSIKKNGKDLQRQGSIELLHQGWRYGAKLESHNDSDLEQKLDKIISWIEKELKYG